jgi:signal transduction histidine kinase/DNA-binding response OmpR family regulator
VVSARYGVFYIAETKEPGDTRLRLLSAFAPQPTETLKQEVAIGEGLIGECAKNKERIILNDVPMDYIKVSSGLGEAKPANIVVLPTLFEGQMKAVLELASFEAFNPTQLAFLDQLVEVIGIVLNNLEATLRTETLLKSLQHQQEELRRTNQALEEKADQLALTSKYKSEFLSNMSHELRTPLNSMLILSQQLAEDSAHLTDKQIEYAKTIHASGGDLLALINDILDLSKVESGTMTLDLNNMAFTEMRQHLDRVFRHVAESKDLHFAIEVDPTTPEEIYTDSKRLEQILRNLLSNAFKFTEKGYVSVRVAPANSGWSADHPVLSQAESVIAFTVSDTGIGIPREKQKIIFEAFQQAESGTSRKYGGTGLGLSISRELAKLLGGQVVLASSVSGRGSTFVLYLPTTYRSPSTETKVDKKEEPTPFLLNMPYRLANRFTPDTIEPKVNVIEDDRNHLQPGDQVLLIIEDEPAFARILLDAAHEKGFKAVAAVGGDAALRLVSEIKPSAVTLDIRLPDMDGWKVLARFKNDPNTRHIPIQIISADEDRLRGFQEGVVAFFSKPVSKDEMDQSLDALRVFSTRRVRNLLLLAGEKGTRDSLKELLGGDDVVVTPAKGAEEALDFLKKNQFDCMVLVPDKESLGILKALKKANLHTDLPIVVYEEHEITKKEEESLKLAAKTYVIKEVKSAERLFDETALYLHRVTAKLPEGKRKIVEKLHQPGQIMVGKKALVVDDDMRNIFAMTSLLERSQMTVVSAESGKEALEVLDKNPDVDVVLMDIMMPEMDGYDTMRTIRKGEKYKSLPIIAVTAKAMKGDREKCIEMGASDYITKPIDSDQLLSLMQNWLYR